MLKLMKFFAVMMLMVVCMKGYAQQHYLARMVTFKMMIPRLERERTIRVLLPAGYNHFRNYYPVIYMQDGQNLFSTIPAPFGNWYADSTMNAVPADKRAIIVAVDHGDTFRLSEYSPYDSQYAKAEGDIYLDFVVHKLKPYVDSAFRTKPDPKHTAIIGSSMGGLISMYAGIKYPNVFGWLGVLSPSFWLAPPMYTDVQSAKPDCKQHYFLSCGDKEGNETEYVLRMDTLLIGKGFKRNHVPKVLVIKDAKHNEAQWRVSFAQFCRWMLR